MNTCKTDAAAFAQAAEQLKKEFRDACNKVRDEKVEELIVLEEALKTDGDDIPARIVNLTILGVMVGTDIDNAYSCAVDLVIAAMKEDK